MQQADRFAISLEEVEGLRQDAKRLAEEAGDLQSLWWTEAGYFERLNDRGLYRESRAQLFDVVLKLAGRIDDPVIRVSAALFKAAWEFPSDALATIEAALVQLPADAREWIDSFGRKPYYWLRLMKGRYLCHAGRAQEGLEEIDRLLRLVPGGEFLAFRAHSDAVGFARLIGDRSRVLSHRQALQEIAESSDVRYPALSAVGSAQVLEGKPGLAIQTFIEAIDLYAQQQVTDFRLQLWAQLAGAHLLCGNLDEARAAAERAVETEGGLLVIEPCITLARVLRVSEGAAAVDEIEAQLRRAKARIERYGHALLTPFLSEESAHLARLLGDGEGCEHHFRDAHRLYTEIGAVGHAERVGRELLGLERE